MMDDSTDQLMLESSPVKTKQIKPVNRVSVLRLPFNCPLVVGG